MKLTNDTKKSIMNSVSQSHLSDRKKCLASIGNDKLATISEKRLDTDIDMSNSRPLLMESCQTNFADQLQEIGNQFIFSLMHIHFRVTGLSKLP